MSRQTDAQIFPEFVVPSVVTESLLTIKQLIAQNQTTNSYFIQSMQTQYNNQQLTMNSLPSQPTNPKKSGKEGFPKILVRKLRLLIAQFILAVSPQQKNLIKNIYLQYWMACKEQTRKSLNSFLMGDQNRTEQFAAYLRKKKHMAQLSLEDIGECRDHLRTIICSRNGKMLRLAEESQVIQKDLFVEFVNEFVQGLQKGEVRGKARKGGR